MPPRSTSANTSLSPQHDDQQSVVLRRRSSSDLARQKFGTMPLLPIRGDDSGATLLSANQTLVRPYPQACPKQLIPAITFVMLQEETACLRARWLPTRHDPLVHILCVFTFCLRLLLSHFVSVSPSPLPHSTCVQRRLHNRRTLSMFFVSIVLAVALCLSAPVCNPWCATCLFCLCNRGRQ